MHLASRPRCQSLVIYERIYNMFQAIWSTYHDSMCIVNSNQQQAIIERTHNIHKITLKLYNKYNSISATLLPMHQIAINNTETEERGTGSQNANSHMMRYQMVAHIQVHNLKHLCNDNIVLYNNTWCYNSILARIDGNTFTFTPIISDEPPQQPPPPHFCLPTHNSL